MSKNYPSLATYQFLERYGGLRDRPTVRATQFTYCAVTTDIQLTIDDKPLILLIAQLPRIFN